MNCDSSATTVTFELRFFGDERWLCVQLTSSMADKSKNEFMKIDHVYGAVFKFFPQGIVTERGALWSICYI
ncbi:unnamed protein product [Rhodiola kirilowii]